MNITHTQKAFFQKRARLVKAWSFTGPLLIIFIAASVVWLFFNAPLFINPFEAVSRVESGTLENSTMMVAAVILPMLSLACVFLLMMLIGFLYAAIAIEKKYIQIVEPFLENRR